MTDKKENDPFFRSSALTEADKKLADPNSNKSVFLLTFEDLGLKKVRWFLLTNFDNKQPILDFKGFEVNKTLDTSSFITWADVLTYASEKKLKLNSLSVPWHRVNNVQNITFNNKQ